jgi:NADH-quinone oxidoreductase subunit B
VQTEPHPRRDRRGRRHTLRVLHVPLACCALEYLAATERGLLAAFAEALTDDPAQADVLVVSGTVTHASAPTVRALYDAMAATGRRRYVVAVGACTISGGPYWDSYAALPGIGALVPVDVVVPGCPPPPEAIAAALAGLAGPADPAGEQTP